MDDPRSLISEWMQKVEEAPKERKKSVDRVIERLKDESDAPSVGDEVKIDFNETSRPALTPQQEEIDGSTGTVRVRDPFSKGSQRARYTVEVQQDGKPKMIHNLTPGEVKVVEKNQ